MALSTRASTESPLRQHVETRDGRTTIRLSHATKHNHDAVSRVTKHPARRSGKHAKAPAHGVAKRTKKASSHVQDLIAHTARSKTHHATTIDKLLGLGILLKGGVHAKLVYDTELFRIVASLSAKVEAHGVEIRSKNGALDFMLGNQTIFSIPSKFLAELGPAVETAKTSADGAFRALTSLTASNSSGTISESAAPDGFQLTTTVDGTTTKITFNLITDSVTVEVDKTVPVGPFGTPTDFDMSVTITPKKTQETVTEEKTIIVGDNQGVPGLTNTVATQGDTITPGYVDGEAGVYSSSK